MTGRKVIRAWNRGDADRTNENTPVEIVPQGDRLLIRTNQDRAPDNQRVSDDLEVTVPARHDAWKRAAAPATSKSSDIKGDVELVTDRADVRLSRGSAATRGWKSAAAKWFAPSTSKGKIDLQGHGSDVELENIQGQVTINGSYMGTLEFKNLAQAAAVRRRAQYRTARAGDPGPHQHGPQRSSPASDMTGPMRLVTGSRDIKLEQFTQSLELETQRGDIQLQPAHAGAVDRGAVGGGPHRAGRCPKRRASICRRPPSAARPSTTSARRSKGRWKAARPP